LLKAPDIAAYARAAKAMLALKSEIRKVPGWLGPKSETNPND
jgi:hypothetical protein